MTRVLGSLVLLGSAVAFSGVGDGAGGPQTRSFVAPAPREARTVPAPPALPAGADAVVPMSFTAVTVRSDLHGTPQTLTQRVTRTSDRVRLVPAGSDKEWLFQRNPVDPRRVSGFLIDHATRQILVYQESDVRNRQQFRGWADVLMMRFDPHQLASMQRTDESHAVAGVSTVRYVDASGAAGITEVAWSAQLLLPLHLTVKEAGVVTTSSIEQLTGSVNAAELADPRRRFPDYDVVDIADAGEHRP